jgi:hypothetical protein
MGAPFVTLTFRRDGRHEWRPSRPRSPVTAPVTAADETLAPGSTRELYLEALRHDPTNSAAYDYLAMTADPIVYFAQVAALAAEEEAREGMQAPLPPLWPRVLHLLVDLKLPPDSTPGALIPLPAILRALRSSNEHLQTLGLRAMIRLNSCRAARVPLEVRTVRSDDNCRSLRKTRSPLPMQTCGRNNVIRSTSTTAVR